MLTLPYLLIGALIAATLSFGGGWHYASKRAAAEVATLKAEAQVVEQTNARLAASVQTVKADCDKAISTLKADVTKRKRAVTAAKREASDAAAIQRGTINGLKVKAYSAADSESNCAAARDILDQLAKDRAK